MSSNTIHLKGHACYEEAVANAALSPGHAIELMSTGKVRKNTVAGKKSVLRVATEDGLQGKTIDDAYAADDVVGYKIMPPGTQFQGRVAAAAVALSIGDRVVTSNDGTFKKYSGASGELLYSATANSAAHAATTTAANFDKTFTIPANFLQVGDVLKIRALVQATATLSTETLTLLLTIGGETVATTGAVDVADGDVGLIDMELVVRAIGATGELQGAGYVSLGVPGTVTAKAVRYNDATVATNGDLVVAINADWSTANANSARLELFDIELVREYTPVAEVEEAVDNSAGVAEAFAVLRAI